MTEMAAKSLTIAVPLPDRTLCGNGKKPASRGAKIGRDKLVSEQRANAQLVACEALKAFPSTRCYFSAGRVRVDVLVRRDPLWAARALDDDNFWIGLKPTRDGLQDAGVVANDRQFRLGLITWETTEPLRGEVVLTLTAERD